MEQRVQREDMDFLKINLEGLLRVSLCVFNP
jgi:hypothetical protein